jgi:tRNA(Ile)-lysidine synthetase, N-terminal domain
MVLVAVSGGRDSMVLAEKVRRSGGPFAVAHCNFRLRGADSDADEALVREWTGRYGVTCHVKAFDTKGFADDEGISIEMAARRLRYRWFGQLCRENGYEAVLTAHHAGDNAETFFLNLLRGSGVKGLCGMQEDGFLPDPDYADIPLRRPLLRMTRAGIDALAAEWNLPWREDRTNAENTVKRNKLRNQVFPLLREINPSFEETLTADMDRLRLVERIAVRFYEEHVGLVWDGRRIDTAFLKTIPGWEYILYRILEGEGMAPPLIAQATDIVRSGQGGRRAGCFISAAGRLVREEAVEDPEIRVSEEPWEPGRSPVMPEGVLAVDADKVHGSLVADRWAAGDWIRPLGMRGRKKLQDWFKDRHFSLVDKRRAVVVRDSGLSDAHHVVAVAGHTIDEAYKITADTRRILKIEAGGGPTESEKC